MPLIKSAQYGPNGGASSKTVPFEMIPHGSVVVAVVRFEHQQRVGSAIHDALCSVTRVFPSTKLSSVGMAVISLDLLSTRRWPSTDATRWPRR